MATRKRAVAAETTVVEKAQVMTGDQPARFRFGEMGNLGIPTYNGITVDELKQELNFPRSVMTFKEMSYHSAVNAPLTLYDNIIGKLVWSFKPMVDATPQEIEQCKIVETMMKDMDQPWSEFIRETLSACIYGFSVHEINLRYRRKEKGSLYDDGLIGFSSLPIRAQESIEKFIFSDDGNDVIGVKQNLTLIQNSSVRFANLQYPQIVIPRKKFLLFRTGKHRGDPYGRSPLRDAYLAWRYLIALEELEATGVSKDLTGFPVLHIPMEFMSESASPSHKKFREYCENAIRNIQSGNQAGMVMPMAYDENSKQPLFKMELLSTDGKRGFDIDKIKTYYKNLILTSLFGDILVMGQNTTGSFALGAIKNSLSGSFAETLADSIANTLNRDLARLIYDLNGWDTSRMGSFDYEGLDVADLDSLSKFLQRTASVDLVEKDRSMLNFVRQAVGLEPLPDNIEPRQEYLGGGTSRAGDGMQTAFPGTATSATDGNESENNLENAA